MATIRPSKKKMFLVRISKKKKKEVGGRFFLLFIISYSMLSLHVITFPQGYVGALRSNILIKRNGATTECRATFNHGPNEAAHLAPWLEVALHSVVAPFCSEQGRLARQWEGSGALSV